jgi:hypothetical protein
MPASHNFNQLAILLEIRSESRISAGNLDCMVLKIVLPKSW